jgi:hypothetical protein
MKYLDTLRRYTRYEFTELETDCRDYSLTIRQPSKLTLDTCLAAKRVAGH